MTSRIEVAMMAQRLKEKELHYMELLRRISMKMGNRRVKKAKTRMAS